MRSQRGQTAVEYVGLLFVVSVLIAGIASSGVDHGIAVALRQQVCLLLNGAEGRCKTLGSARVASAPDGDGDGLSDAAERRLGTRTGVADSDRDGLLDGDEVKRHTDPNRSDSDGDGLDDAREIRLTAAGRGKFDPVSADADHDTLTDAQEVAIGTPPTSADMDVDGHGGLTDGLTDAQELRLGTDPKRIDTDGDGTSDGNEVRDHTNPLVDERSLGRKVSAAAFAALLDDPSNLSPKGLVKGAGKLGGKVLRKILRTGGRDAARSAAKDAEKALTAGATRRAKAERAAKAHKPVDRLPMTPGPGGRTFVTTPKGYTVEIPAGWKPREADNGRGIVYQRPGADAVQRDADSIRIAEPTKSYPEGYVRYYNSSGQAIDAHGKPTSPAETHFPLDAEGRPPIP